MPLKLYAHPFSSYCQKALIAFYENETPFDYCLLEPGQDQTLAEHAALWPLQRFPVLTDGARTVVETTIIIEYLGLHHPGPVQLIPSDPDSAIQVRMLDRFFDNYIMTPTQKIVGDSLRNVENRDGQGVAEARQLLEVAYRWLNNNIADKEWAAGEAFSLADCAAAPALFYADWAHPMAAEFSNVRAYRQRLLARPAYARAVDEARPHRPLFPLGAPDRD
ncbi:MAG: Glutathione S-transferase domain protein [Verrucomicrobiaceae bacterium]|nr:Glutathione S-transferase domain protein [Verrucomicrobiaceae bacterium]